MSNAAPVQLRQVRDLGQNITDTFAFLRQNWRPIYKAIVFVCLPPVLIAGLLFSNLFNSVLRGAESGLHSPLAAFGPMLLAYLLMLLVTVLYIGIVHEFIRNYTQGLHLDLSVGTLVKQAVGQSLNYLGIVILAGILITVGMVLCILPGIWMAVSLCLAPVAHAVERWGVTGSLTRSFDLVKGHWWETLGLAIVVYLIMMVISYALMTPLYALLGLSMFSGFEPGRSPEEATLFMRTVMPLMMIVSMGVNMLVYPIGAISMAMRYFTLVETKEHVGLGERVKGFDAM